MHLVAFHSLHDLNTPAAKILYAFPTIDFRNSTIFHKLIFWFFLMSKTSLERIRELEANIEKNVQNANGTWFGNLVSFHRYCWVDEDNEWQYSGNAPYVFHLLV